MDADIFEQFQRQMVKAWDAKDYKLCSFKHILYNDLCSADAEGQMRPPPAAQLHQARFQAKEAADTGLWQQADAANPDPSRFVPVQITGFDALAERRAQQVQSSEDIAALLKASQEKIAQLDQQRKVAIGLRLRHYRERQQVLSRRVLMLRAAIDAQHQARVHGPVEPPLSGDERAWIARLSRLGAAMTQPDAGPQRAYELSLRQQQQPGQLADDGLPSETKVDLDNLEDWLGRQQAAIEKLIAVSKDDLKDCEMAFNSAQGRES